MVFSVPKAVDFLKTCCSPTDGLLMDEPGGTEKFYIFNQCALSATALKRAGETAWAQCLADNMNRWMNQHKSKLNLPIPNMMHPLLDQSLVKTRPSFKAATDIFLRGSGGKGSVIVNQCPTDTMSGNCTAMASNRAFLRCIHLFQTGQKVAARACWDHAMKSYDGFAIMDANDVGSEGRRYTCYKTGLQWYAAKVTGFGSRVRPDLLDKMQDANGKVRQFFTKNYASIRPLGNSETTSIAILAYLR